MDHDVEAPGVDRIRAKIADAVKTRRRESPVAVRAQYDPTKPLTKGRGHGPQPLSLIWHRARMGCRQSHL